MTNAVSNARSNKLLLIIAVLYIAHALPLYFFNVAVPAILRQQGVDVRWIGMLSLLYLPWAFKFLWASVVDNHYSLKFGKRKTWLFSTQIIIVMGLAVLAQLNWAQIGLLLGVSLLISIASATQDIAIDGYTVEQFESSQFNWVSTTQSIGVALGSMLGGAGVLWLYESYTWQTAVMVLAILISLISVVLTRLPDKKALMAHHTQQTNSQSTLGKANLKAFFKRRDVRWLLLLIVVFRFVEAPAMAMLNPMLVDLGWTLKQIGFLFSVLGAIVGILSAVSAGWLIKKQGASHWLLMSGWLRTAIYAVIFGILAFQTKLIALSIFDLNSFSVATGLSILGLLAIRYMTMTALYTLFMQHSSQQQAGTDFTVFVCVELLVFFIGGAISGFLVHQFGYRNLFLVLGLVSAVTMLVIPTFLNKLKTS